MPAPGGHIQRQVAVILYITRIGATTWTGASAGSVGRGRWMQRPISRRHHQIEDLRVTACLRPVDNRDTIIVLDVYIGAVPQQYRGHGGGARGNPGGWDFRQGAVDGVSRRGKEAIVD